jgi:hypothetical protein
MEAVCSSEMSVGFCRITYHYIPEGGILKLQFSHISSHQIQKLGLTRKNLWKGHDKHLRKHILPVPVQNTSETINVRDLGRGISPVARLLPTQDNINGKETQAYIHISSGIRTHNPNIRASEDISCLRPHGHWQAFMKTGRLY